MQLFIKKKKCRQRGLPGSAFNLCSTLQPAREVDTLLVLWKDPLLTMACQWHPLCSMTAACSLLGIFFLLGILNSMIVYLTRYFMCLFIIFIARSIYSPNPPTISLENRQMRGKYRTEKYYFQLAKNGILNLDFSEKTKCLLGLIICLFFLIFFTRS